MFRDINNKVYKLDEYDRLIPLECNYPVTQVKYFLHGLGLRDGDDMWHTISGKPIYGQLNGVSKIRYNIEAEINGLTTARYLRTPVDETFYLIDRPEFKLVNNVMTCTNKKNLDHYGLTSEDIPDVVGYHVCYTYIAILTIDSRMRVIPRIHDPRGPRGFVGPHDPNYRPNLTTPNDTPTITSIIDGKTIALSFVDTMTDTVLDDQYLNITDVIQFEVYNDVLFIITSDRNMYRVVIDDHHGVDRFSYSPKLVKKTDDVNIILTHRFNHTTVKRAEKCSNTCA